MIPFTRYALWRKRGAPSARDQISGPGGSRGSSQTQASLGAVTNAPVGTSGFGPIVPYAGMRHPSTTSFMPDPIREAFDYFEKDAPTSGEKNQGRAFERECEDEGDGASHLRVEESSAG